jgi:phage terminase large subunit-like protein
MNDYKDGIQYAHDIVENRIVANKYIKLACQRFLDDLDNADASWYFNQQKAQHIHDFYSYFIKHVTGDIAGDPYILSPWESFILDNLYGFVSKEDHTTRRFHNAIVYVARKNSKTTLGGAMVLYHLLSDNQEGAQAFSVATQSQQAKIAWSSAGRMIDKMPEQARKRFTKTISSIDIKETFNSYKFLGRDSKALDGLNCSFALFDESAAITDRNMFEVIQSSQGSRKNFLNLHITTAQFNKETYFHEQYSYLKKILEGEVTDDSYFGVLYELDKESEWEDPDMWIKANPNIGHSVNLEFLKNELNLAYEIPSKKTNFMVKHMNMYQSSSDAWLPTTTWREAIVDKINTTGKLWVGVDLGSTSDLTALTFLYQDGDKYTMDYKCFIPESALSSLPKYLKTTYANALKSGSLILTEGNATDYNVVKDFLKNYIADKDLQEIAYDPWSSTKFITELYAEGAPCVEVNQSMKSLSPASKETEIHIRKGEIQHLDDAFLEWQFNNCTRYTDINGNIKIRKGDDQNLKIDAIVALILAISRATAAGGLKKSNFNFKF